MLILTLILKLNIFNWIRNNFLGFCGNINIVSIKYDYYLTFIKNLLIILEEQLTSKNERIAILTKKTTRDKLLQYFKLTSIKKGSRTFTIPYSFTELAGYLSVDRSAMTREIKYLKDEGFIKIDKKRITIDYM